MYREVAVWKRIDDKGAVKFNCLEYIDSHQFAVQSADFYTVPIKNAVIDDFDSFAKAIIARERTDNGS
jgi:hypothetical protein